MNKKKFEKIYDWFTGSCIRKIEFTGCPTNSIYLTFDDGPDPYYTPSVLDLLQQKNIKATFFVIISKTIKHPEILKRIISEGHSIGNHSLDHNTLQYFKNYSSLKIWLEKSSVALPESVGFRSPVGIKTPTLNKILKEKKWPLILWDTRFYDTVFPLKKKIINKKVSFLRTGSIILLHDTLPVKRHNQKKLQEKKETFLDGLSYLIDLCKAQKLTFSPLTKELIMKTYLEKS